MDWVHGCTESTVDTARGTGLCYAGIHASGGGDVALIWRGGSKVVATLARGRWRLGRIGSLALRATASQAGMHNGEVWLHWTWCVG